LLGSRDPYHCESTKLDGQWLDTPHANGSRYPFWSWQPTGCLLHQYSSEDILACVEDKKIVFAGDSTVRQIYWATLRKMKGNYILASKHESQSLTFAETGIKFIWDPFLNSTDTYDELKRYRDAKTGEGPQKGSPALILLGTGAWISRHFDMADGIEKYRDTIDNVSQYTSFPSSLSSTLATSRSAEVGDQAFLQPVQVPIYDFLEGIRKETIIPGEVEAMNTYLQDTSLRNNVLWSYLAMTGQEPLDALEPTGFHCIDSIADAKADVLLNLRCNAKLDKLNGYPHDRTCCSNYKRRVDVQLGFIVIGATLFTLAFWGFIAKTQNETRDAIFVMSASVFYCFSADRTEVFNHFQKHFENAEFIFLSGLVLLAGLLSLRRSGSLTAVGTRKDQAFLSRDQTEEWKGWMQFAILLYHWTGASSVLWIYKTIRLMVASYLFLIGFGHTCFFLQKGDYGFKRLATVLIRLNLLSCVLPYIMGTDYMFYYFAPLATFWFGVVWCTMRVFASRNSFTAFVLIKIFLAAILVNLSIELSTFDLIFRGLETFCRISWDVYEWKFRLGLDRYIVFVGMTVAVLYEGYRGAVVSNTLPRAFQWLRIITIIASLIAIPFVQAVYQGFGTKQLSNANHPLLAIIPVLAYVVLRNAASSVRNFHSAIFAWLGAFSLETFTLQCHIWLAADTKGLLSLGIFHSDGSLLGGRWRDFVVLTPLFFWVSWKVSAATSIITAWVVQEYDSEENEKASLEAGLIESLSSLGVLMRVKRILWPRDLRLRVCVLLVAMWALNMVNSISLTLVLSSQANIPCRFHLEDRLIDFVIDIMKETAAYRRSLMIEP
ncbi:Cas1p-domain-containing protein, partial [Thozetella sp. PMI_491]